ncbi:MAG TPA: TrkA family potassium uptake protein [Candidatus Krumholzibacteria bacterium]|nr:TrkA family potassium uptake protein [Candidatus Krumholzibacteria bacterium]
MLKVVVIGLGRFGSTVATDLCRRGCEVLAVDRTMRLVEEVLDRVSVAVGFDATDRQNLEAYDVGSMDVAIIAVGTNFEASVLVTMHCKALGVGKIYAKALTPMQAAVLQKVGADHIVRPEEDMGLRLAESLVEQKAVEFVDLPDGYGLRRLKVPAAWDGRSLADLGLLARERLGIIQVVRRPGPDGDREKIPLPHGSIVLYAGDQIDAIGRSEVLDRFA